MEMDFTPGWVAAHIGVAGDRFSLKGINLWKFDWQRISEEPIVVPHPSYPHERHLAWIYEIESSGKKIQFAAGELSNGVYGFYLPS